jgi:hypothetical protein
MHCTTESLIGLNGSQEFKKFIDFQRQQISQLLITDHGNGNLVQGKPKSINSPSSLHISACDEFHT